MSKTEITTIENAIKKNPSNPSLYNHLGLICYKNQLYTKAIDAWKMAISINPGYMDAIVSLGLSYIKDKQYTLAREILTKGLQYQENNIPCLINLALAFHMDTFMGEAAELYEKILSLDAANQNALFGYGKLSYETGHYKKAILLLKRFVDINPDIYDATYLLGCAFQDDNQYKEALNCFQSIIDKDPDFVSAYYNIGKMYQHSGQFSLAENYYKNAIQIKKNFAEGYASLGSLYLDIADIDNANAMFLKAMKYKQKKDILSVYLYFLNFNPDTTNKEMAFWHHQWGEKVSSYYPQCSHQHHDYRSDRKLKIGYISPDFRDHSVFYFFSPILFNHDTDRFIIYIYSNVQKKDHLTEKIKFHCNKFRNIRGMSASSASSLIQNDKIDILVDLAGHTYNHRLDIFAMKSAPIQVTYIGYPNTTGLSQMDYRLTDSITDPLKNNSEYSENVINLSPPFICYYPPEKIPEISALPFLKNQYITFGSFNYLGKINNHVIQSWAELLREIPESRLIIKSRPLSDISVQKKIIELFIHEGVEKERIFLIGHVHSKYQHLSLYNQVDIALDPFPYNGTTTTCEALLMGVPVLTIEGSNHAGRVSKSLLISIGLQDFIAKNQFDFIDKAQRLFREQPLLIKLRSHLRGILFKSKLCDSLEHTRLLESAFTIIWKKKCNTIKKKKYFC